jgi:hypothetical protein
MVLEPSQRRQKAKAKECRLTKREGQRKAKKTQSLQENKRKKKGRELVPLVVGSYLTHGPSNVTCMQRSIPTLRYSGIP